MRILHYLPLAAVILAAGAAPAVGAGPVRPHPTLVRRVTTQTTREDTLRALHLLSRATFGATPRDLDEVLRMGRDAWLERQLHPERIDDSALDARLAAFPAASMAPAALLAAYPVPRQNPAQRAARDSLRRAREAMGEEMGTMMRDSAMAPNRPARRRMAGDSAMAGGVARARAGGRPQGPAAILFDLAGAKLQRAVYSQRQLEEVMTDFWFNHFNVFFGKNADRYLVGAYERDAIRPHVFGKFRDLLGATATHPAMLVYLDNAQSIVPDSMRGYTPQGQGMGMRMRPRPGGDSAAVRRPRGLNENYARELMELHTLGVDGGYTQHDVTEVARALTGWSVDARALRSGQEPRFVFRAAAHDYGPKTILGRRFPAGRGAEEGEEILDMLARSPATARHLSYQLAQRFVADEPPPALVDRLAQVWMRTDGDLRAVTRALFTAPEFDDARVHGAKVKTPVEFVASALRATGAEVGPAPRLLQALRQMGQLPYASQPPTGYPNTSMEWSNSAGMLARMNFGLGLASAAGGALRIDAARFEPALRESSAEAQVAALARVVIPGFDDPRLVRTIAADLDAQPALNPRQKAARALGLLLGSPAFQRR